MEPELEPMSVWKQTAEQNYQCIDHVAQWICVSK